MRGFRYLSLLSIIILSFYLWMGISIKPVFGGYCAGSNSCSACGVDSCRVINDSYCGNGGTSGRSWSCSVKDGCPEANVSGVNGCSSGCGSWIGTTCVGCGSPGDGNRGCWVSCTTVNGGWTGWSDSA